MRCQSLYFNQLYDTFLFLPKPPPLSELNLSCVAQVTWSEVQVSGHCHEKQEEE